MIAAVALHSVYNPKTLMADQGMVNYLWMLMKERSTEEDKYVNISHRALPSYEDHCLYVDNKPYRNWYVVHAVTPSDTAAPAQAYPVGTVYLTRRNEIGIVLGRAHRGKGYGTAAMEALLSTHRPLEEIKGERRECWIANINPANEPSIRLFTKLGGVHIQNTYEIP